MKFSFKKALCLLLTVCILCSTFALPVFADAEMIALAVEAMKAVGLKEFQISVGNIEFFKGI